LGPSRTYNVTLLADVKVFPTTIEYGLTFLAREDDDVAAIAAAARIVVNVMMLLQAYESFHQMEAGRGRYGEGKGSKSTQHQIKA
jgi:hypothetical protein